MWEALQNWPGSVALRGSSTLYLLVNAAHVLGIALLLGPILALDARLLGVARQVPLSAMGPFLANTAMLGVVIAVVTGFALFTVQPANYVANPAFLIKLAILALALANAISVALSLAWRKAVAGNEIAAHLRWQAAASFILWIATLVAGRWIGFV